MKSVSRTIGNNSLENVILVVASTDGPLGCIGISLKRTFPWQSLTFTTLVKFKMGRFVCFVGFNAACVHKLCI
jgi:hypothetical protein